MLSMDLRKYDPAIARWTGIDPVTHHSMSPYTAFDNNPIFWADPSGADSFSDRMNAKSQWDRMGINYIAGEAGNNNTGNQGDCCKGSGTTNDPIQLDEVVINASTGGGQGGFDADTPDWLQNGEALSYWETSYKGSLSDYNTEFGVSFNKDHLYEQYYYKNFYEPELSALRGGMQAAQAEAAKYVIEGAMLLAPLPKIGLASKALGQLSTKATQLSNKVGVTTNVLGNNVFNNFKRGGINTLSSFVSKSSFATKRNLVKFGTNRIKGSINTFGKFEHDVINTATFKKVERFYNFGNDVLKFFK